MQSTKTLALSAIFAAALAACGGGGGDATPTATTPTATTPTATTPTATTPPAPTAQSTIVTSVPAATYAAGSDERAAYDLLNSERQKCGFGLLAQSTKLDAAAAAHSTYQIQNNTSGHAEILGSPGFTGVNSRERANFQGYEGTRVGEDIGFEPSGIENIRGLFSAPYHTTGLATDMLDVGLSFKSTSAVQLTRAALTVDVGMQPSKAFQTAGAGTVLTYPCSGSDGLVKDFFEAPNWNTAGGAGRGGTPIYVSASNRETLAITSASITPVGGGVVPVQVLTAANDPNKILRAHQALIIPPSSLVANSSYRVQITGTVAGAAFSKDFTFKTGA